MEPQNDIPTRVARLEEASKNVKEDIIEIKNSILSIENNHLHSIYTQLNDILIKLSTARPSWTVSILLTVLFSLCTGLIVIILKG